MEDPDQVEVSFVRNWDPSFGNKSVPLNIDIRFVMLHGIPGLYSYAIYEHLEGWPDFDLAQTRIVFKPSKDMFHYMAISDERQRIMPMPEDRDTGQPLAYKEAVLLTNPINPDLKGEVHYEESVHACIEHAQVDDKYQYSCENKDCNVHGWISNDPFTGFWTITPSNEFQSNGPCKQDLTSHVGPTTLATFHSLHYSGEDVVLKFRDGERWKKVLGPVFFYFNAVDDDLEDPYSTLWEDAKNQMMNEVQSWPYQFPNSEDYPHLEQRGTVTGRLIVQDRYISEDYISADSAYVGMALPGDPGSWQREGKGYQFWTKADSSGIFSINNVHEGDYSLYAYVPSFIGDYKYDVIITITPGCVIDVGDLVYEPPRNGPTFWEIGIADRSSAEFFIPEPDPNYINKLYEYLNQPNRAGMPSKPVHKFRQYGLWERYTELYPDGDLLYVIDISDYSNDWFYAHVTRKNDDNTYQATTWQVLFELDNVDSNGGNYTLRLALASATVSDLHVRVNDPETDPALFTTGLIGKDNAIARHGIHGLYWLFNVNVPSNLLVEGFNTIYLTQSRDSSPFQGIMYDYIRLEGPPDQN
ncbi:Rhamnogalacturonate lyase [Thalictrum thalictroides]|uniref:Rhamnogalacturonate lyase n=1 Tax=Thalictrum thalictroides TaxID=46969 RepID=A0A7J6W5A4_THATH|nr:Rhamnogalacturonate lyase [Thalictrum thalictroides]